ncbi:MAG: hypothetical protein E7603_00200 [Ruminococcaceae bacterium]|nr:hypothetical protein [Oscillospiraceae bacterium]
MKRHIALILAAIMIFALCFTSCNNTGTVESTPSNGNTGTSAKPENSSSSQTSGSSESSKQPENTTAGCSHNYGDWMTTKAPTCMESGSKVRICSKCSHAQTGEAAALGHTTETGICERCGENIGQSLAEAIRSVIEIYEVYVSKIDSAGGVNMGVAFTNKSDKTIKYIHFYVRPYNAVGDSQKCEIRGYSRFDAYITGPLEGGHEGYSRYGENTSGGHHWDACWYNNSISYIDLEGVKIEYMDGSTYSLNSEEVKLAFTDYPIIDEVEDLGYKTGFSYNSQDETFNFRLMLVNRHHVSLARNAKVDVRFVNGNNEIVFSKTYRIDEADFVEDQEFSLGTIKYASFSINDWEIEGGTTGSGYLYYKVYSDDGEFSFEEKSEFTSDLPKETESYDTYLNTEGLSYNGYYLTLYTSNGSLFAIHDVTETTKNSKMTITVRGIKLAGPKTYQNPIKMTVLAPNGFIAGTLTGDPWAYESGDTFSYTVTLNNVGDGEYTLCFDERLCDSNGLYYNISENLNAFSAYLSNQTVEHLVVPSSFLNLPVTALETPWNIENSSLKSIEIPACVTIIDGGIFSNCNNLTSITVAQNNPVYHSAGNCIIETASKTLIAGCSTSVIPADGSVTCIYYSAFDGIHGLKNIVIPEIVTKILDGAFQNCTSLESIQLPSSLIELGSMAFSGCRSLKSVTVPEKITELNAYLFSECTSLETVVFEGDVTDIYTGAFYLCSSLKTCDLPSSVTYISDYVFEGCTLLTEKENGLFYVGNWLVGAEDGIFDADIRMGTIGIAGNIFALQTTLKTVYIPASVRHIGNYVFESCSNLRKATIENGIDHLSAGLFANCYRLEKIIFTGTKAQWEALEKNSSWFNGKLTVICTDGEESFANIKSNSSHIWWTNVSSGQDRWNFNNPYIKGSTLYIPCTQVIFAAPFSWNDKTDSGKLTGEAAVTNYFNGIKAKVSGTYEKKEFSANEAQSFILEIPLDELNQEKPEELYLRLEALVNGKLSYVLINFEINW